MTLPRVVTVAVALSLLVLGASMKAQPPAVAAQAGQVGLGLVLRQLGNVGVFLQAVGHPDDENSALLALLAHGQGVRTAVLTATRGTGGQNEIGPELFEALSVLRTAELAAVHRYDGTEQYFARAIDFGYSFSVEETFRKWGRREILADYVRMIRTIRPDVIVTMSPDGEQGGAHHQAQARITGEAFRLAADPSSFPEQLKEGLRPWEARKLYYSGGFGGRGGPPSPAVAAGAAQGQVRVNTDVYDPLLGQTYVEIGSQARSNHKCQGMAQLLSLPGGGAGASYRLGDTTLAGGAERADTALFDGIDTRVGGLADFARAAAPDALKSGLAAIAVQVDAAQKAFRSQGADQTMQPIVAGLGAVRALRARLGSLNLDEGARFEIDSRLKLKEDQFQRAAVLAQGIRIDVLADDGVVFAGQPLRVQTIVANRGPADISVKKIALSGFDGDAACAETLVKAGAVVPRCDAAVKIPAGARLTTPYWRPLADAARYEFDGDAPFGLPFRPTPFVATIELTIGGADVTVRQPVEYRYEGNIFSGEKRMELLVVPRFAASVTPEIAIMPMASLPVARPANAGGGGVRLMELRVVVVNGNKGAAKADVSLELPNGWKAFPSAAPLEFAREDAAETVRFQVVPASGAKPGQYDVRAVVRAGTESFDRGYQVIEYPHVRRQHLVLPAHAAIKVIDVKMAPGLSVGYVMGVGDQVPPAIAQLGARVTLLDADALAWGNLSGYDAIVTGVRAYERRADLRANNRRLLDYAANGGTLIVQYNKTEFNEAQYGPYPARVSSSRVTDETAPVEVLVPASPLFTFPNTVGAATWKDWVQERGLYFLGEKDAKYVDLVQLQDPFPANGGMKKGALVEARVGKGRWIYVGLGLWRQLPAGTDGAYQLLANLIGAGKAPQK
jgi:LmbE family N-acetylglucosaminyl deacetylase